MLDIKQINKITKNSVLEKQYLLAVTSLGNIQIWVPDKNDAELYVSLGNICINLGVVSESPVKQALNALRGLLATVKSELEDQLGVIK